MSVKTNTINAIEYNLLNFKSELSFLEHKINTFLSQTIIYNYEAIESNINKLCLASRNLTASSISLSCINFGTIYLNLKDHCFYKSHYRNSVDLKLDYGIKDKLELLESINNLIRG